MFVVRMEGADGGVSYLHCNLYGEQNTMQAVDLASAYQIPLRSAALEFADRAKPYFRVRKVSILTIEAALAMEHRRAMMRFN